MITKNINNSELRAILLSPLMAGPALLLTEFQFDAYLNGGWWLLLIPLLYSTLLAAPFSYACTLVFGLPVYLLLREFHLDKFWIVSLSGLPIGLMVSALFSGLDVNYTKIITTCGVLVSITAASIIYIGKKKDLNNKSDLNNVKF